MATTNSWLKKIFSVGTLSLVVAVVGLYISYKTLMVDAGGELKISYTDFATELSENGISTVIINENSAECINDLLPRFTNPSNYALKDFYLHYDFSGGQYDIAPTGFYDIAEGRNVLTLSLKNTVLPAGATVPEPIRKFSLKGSAERTTMNFTVGASFNGCSAPFNREASYTVIYLPIGRLSQTAWLSKAEKLSSAPKVALWDASSMRKLNVEKPAPAEPSKPAVTTPSQPTAQTDATPKVETEKPTQANQVENREIETAKSKRDDTMTIILVIVMLFFCGLIGFGASNLEELLQAYRYIRFYKWPLSKLKSQFFREIPFDSKIVCEWSWWSCWLTIVTILAVILLMVYIFVFK